MRRRLKLKFESTTDVFVTTEGMRGEEVFGCILPYRDWMVRNLRGAGQIQPQRFVAWMESADRSVMDLPEKYGNQYLEALDEILIKSVRDDNLQPATVVDVLDEWVTESKHDAIEQWDIPPDFFDVSDVIENTEQ